MLPNKLASVVGPFEDCRLTSVIVEADHLPGNVLRREGGRGRTWVGLYARSACRSDEEGHGSSDSGHVERIQNSCKGGHGPTPLAAARVRTLDAIVNQPQSRLPAQSRNCVLPSDAMRP